MNDSNQLLRDIFDMQTCFLRSSATKTSKETFRPAAYVSSHGTIA